MYLCEIQGSKPQKQTLHGIKANSSEIIQFFFPQVKIYKHVHNHSYLVITVSFPFTFLNLGFGEVEKREQENEV